MKRNFAEGSSIPLDPNWYFAEILNGIRKPPLLALMMGVCSLHLAYYLLWSYRPTLFGDLTKEDGLLEYGTAILLLFSGIIFAFGARLSAMRIQRIWCLVFAIALIFMAGEEISWGQRIFRFNVEALEQINTQKETNLHNLPSVHAPRLLSIGSLVCGAILPILLLFSSYFRSLMTDVLSFPVPHPIASLCFLQSYLWYRVFHFGEKESLAALSIEESREFSIGVACLLYAAIWLKSQNVNKEFRMLVDQRNSNTTGN